MGRRDFHDRKRALLGSPGVRWNVDSALLPGEPNLRRLPAAAQQTALDLLDQKRQIGLGEAETGRGDTVVFDVRGDVFVVGVGAYLEQLIDQEL